jgi:hypothetical protein
LNISNVAAERVRADSALGTLGKTSCMIRTKLH